MGLKLLSKYYSEFLIAIIRFEFRKGLLIISKKLKHYCAKEGIWKLSYPRMTSFFTWLIHEKLSFIVQNCPEVFYKKGVIRNFVKLIGKHLSQSLFFNKIAGLATLSKKRLWYRCFPVNFVNLLGTPFFIEHLRWLLLVISTRMTKLRTLYFIGFQLQKQPFADILQNRYFLETSQYSHENTCAVLSLFLIKLKVWSPATALKGDSITDVLLWILPHFHEYLFYRTPLVVAFPL